MSLIYIQLPAPDPMKVLKDRLKEEEHFEEFTKQPSFRANLLRELISKIENK